MLSVFPLILALIFTHPLFLLLTLPNEQLQWQAVDNFCVSEFVCFASFQMTLFPPIDHLSGKSRQSSVNQSTDSRRIQQRADVCVCGDAPKDVCWTSTS